MKMFYTKSELKSLTGEELLELTTFGSDENSYFYSDLERIKKEDAEYSFHFKDGTTVFTQSEETFKEVKVGKARYELIYKSLEENKENKESQDEFYKNIVSMLSKQVKELHDSNKTFALNSEIAIKANGTKLDSHIDSMSQKLDATVVRWNDKIKLLEDFNTNTYNVKMKKLDKIIDAFSEILA